MKPVAKEPAVPAFIVPFREVQHFRPEDALYYESIRVRGTEYEWTIPAHRHDGLHQFQLLTEGSAQATLDGESLHLQAPAALMVAPGVVHGFDYARHSVGQQVTVPTASLRTWFGPASSLNAKLNTSIHVSHEGARGNLDADFEACSALFLQLAHEFAQSHPGRSEALNAYALVLALWFLRHQGNGTAGRRQKGLGDTLVQRYRLLLEQNFRQQRPIHFYAETLGVSANHLSRACRTTTGESALVLLHGRVVLEARRLLVYTPDSVSEIAHQLGFEDPGYFSRFFTKTVGQAPTAYRAAVTRGLGVAPQRMGKTALGN